MQLAMLIGSRNCQGLQTRAADGFSIDISLPQEPPSYLYWGLKELFAHAELQARTGEYSEKGAEVALVAGLVVLGLWATGVLKSDGSDDPDAGRLEQK